MGEQHSTTPGPMATKASDPLLCTSLLCADCVVGALCRVWGGGKAASFLAALRRRRGLSGSGLQDKSYHGSLTPRH